MLYLLRKIYNIKNKEYSYKIYDFDFNGFCIFIYLLWYVCFVLWIRINGFSQTTDLKLIINLLKEKCLSSHFIETLINSIIMLITILCLIYFIRNLHKFFLKQLTKRFLIIHVLYYYHLDLSYYNLLSWPRRISLLLIK